MDEPPYRCDDKNADQDDTVVVHRGYSRGEDICYKYILVNLIRQYMWSILTEAKHDVEEDDKCYCDNINSIARRPHPERAPGNVFPSSKQVRSDS